MKLKEAVQNSIESDIISELKKHDSLLKKWNVKKFDSVKELEKYKIIGGISFDVDGFSFTGNVVIGLTVEDDYTIFLDEQVIKGIALENLVETLKSVIDTE